MKHHFTAHERAALLGLAVLDSQTNLRQMLPGFPIYHDIKIRKENSDYVVSFQNPSVSWLGLELQKDTSRYCHECWVVEITVSQYTNTTMMWEPKLVKIFYDHKHLPADTTLEKSVSVPLERRCFVAFFEFSCYREVAAWYSPHLFRADRTCQYFLDRWRKNGIVLTQDVANPIHAGGHW